MGRGEARRTREAEGEPNLAAEDMGQANAAAVASRHLSGTVRFLIRIGAPRFELGTSSPQTPHPIRERSGEVVWGGFATRFRRLQFGDVPLGSVSAYWPFGPLAGPRGRA